MATRLRLNSAWVAACGAMALAALAVHGMPPAVRLALDWQPTRTWGEPWRWWTAAFVHYGTGHLAMNLAGCAVLALFGAAARLGWRWTLAWAVAWPLGHLLLLSVPGLAHYGGLSGLLHGGVAVAAVAVLAGRSGAGSGSADDGGAAWRQRRWVGGAVAAGLAIKLVLERTWGPNSPWPGMDVPVATQAHITGALSGAACALLAAWHARQGAKIRLSP